MYFFIKKNQALDNIVTEPNIIGEILSARLRWIGHLVRKRNLITVKKTYMGCIKYKWRVKVENELRTQRTIALTAKKTHFESLT